MEKAVVTCFKFLILEIPNSSVSSHTLVLTRILTSSWQHGSKLLQSIFWRIYNVPCFLMDTINTEWDYVAPWLQCPQEHSQFWSSKMQIHIKLHWRILKPVEAALLRVILSHIKTSIVVISSPGRGPVTRVGLTAGSVTVNSNWSGLDEEGAACLQNVCGQERDSILLGY